MITAFIPFLFVLNGCSDAVQPIDPTMPASLIVTPAAPAVGVDSSVTVNVVAVNSNGNPVSATLRWSVSDTMIAVVSDSGLVSGRSQGTVTVSVSSGSARGATSITVRQTNAPEPAPATPPVTPATGAGLSGLAFAYDDFTTYNSTAELIADVPSGDGTATSNPRYVNIVGKSLLSLDPTVKYNGHPSLKYNQPGGSADSPGLVVPVSPSKPSIWIRAKIRWSPAFTTEGTGFGSAGNASSEAYKILGWGWAEYNERGSLEFSNTNQYQLMTSAKDAATGTYASDFAFSAAGNVVNEWTDGQWYDIIVFHERLSNSQMRSRLWIARDGRTPVLRATVNGTMKAGFIAPTVALVTIGMNFNQVRLPNQNQAMWWGQWEVIDGSKYSNPFGVR